MVAEAVIVFKSDVGSERLFVEVFFVVFEQKIGGKNRSTKLCCGQSLLCGSKAPETIIWSRMPHSAWYLCVPIFGFSHNLLVRL